MFVSSLQSIYVAVQGMVFRKCHTADGAQNLGIHQQKLN